MRLFFKQLSLAAALLLTSSLSAAQPYDSLRALPDQPYFLENGYVLSGKVSSLTTPLIFVDVGSPNGEAARFIAANNPSVSVFAISPWSAEGQFHQFLSDVRQENVTSNITVLRMTSAEASNALDLSAGIIYLDCSDSTTVHNNILMWLTQLGDNGVIAGNHWSSILVEQAVIQAAADLNLVLSTNANYWFLTRP